MTDHAPPWLDAHLDLAYMALDRDSTRASLEQEGDPAAMAITLPSLARGNVRCCLATIFTAAFEPDDPCGYTDHEDRAGAHQAGMRQVELYEAWEQQGLVRILHNQLQLESCLQQEDGPLGIVLLMECADPIQSPAEVASWAERGVRMVGLSWAHGSRYSGGNHRGGGLTDEGRELVAALDEAGIAHDVSHLSDESMEDLLALARGPIASSHSNARRLLPEGRGAIRHLRDDHAGEIARRGGVAGVNLYGKFLARDRSATLEDAVEHANVLAEAFGRDRVGLGSDADGGFTPAELPEGLKKPADYHRMTEALAASGWTPEELNGFSSRAWREFLARVPSMA